MGAILAQNRPGPVGRPAQMPVMDSTRSLAEAEPIEHGVAADQREIEAAEGERG